ncbi:hypothetical protein GCM10022207_70970 [Streptomyces lannensis]|uniref:Uncharacterized protein n=1 Tax=Streptomyces lannensis TaxID=766498 RepID=A0ABP7L4L3_9ACTN
MVAGPRCGRADPSAQRAARLGQGPSRAATGFEERGSGDLALLLELEAMGQPISSSALPFVSFTNFRTNGMESAAKTA